MSGHSKWSKIKRKKGDADSARAKVFTKIGKEIMIAVKEGGGDVNNNSKLRELVSKAKANNVPSDNIDRVIKKAMGSGDKASYESNVYEGYGPSGVAVIVETLTDNKNRTAADVRHFFDKFGGNLGTTGCVSFMFETKGMIVAELGDKSEDDVMEDVMELEATDYSCEDGVVEIETDPGTLSKIRDGFIEKGYKLISADVEKIPSTYTKLTDENDIRKMDLLLEHLEDNDDVQNVYHNLED